MIFIIPLPPARKSRHLVNAVQIGSQSWLMHSEATESKFQTAGSQDVPFISVSLSAEIDIEKEIDELHCSPDWKGGLARKVLIRYPDFQVTLRTSKASKSSNS